MRPLLSLFTSLLLASRVLASPPVNLYPIESVNVVGCAHSMTGSATYDFATALTGTTSGPIDLGLVGCFSFSVTGTGSGQVRLWQSNNSTTYTAGTTQTAGVIVATFPIGNKNAQAVYSWTKTARYAWFDFPALSPNISGPNYVTPVANTVTLWHYLPTNWPN